MVIVVRIANAARPDNFAMGIFIPVSFTIPRGRSTRTSASASLNPFSGRSGNRVTGKVLDA